MTSRDVLVARWSPGLRSNLIFKLSRVVEGRWLTKSLAWFALLFLILPSLVVVPVSFGDTRAIVFPPKTWSLALYAQYFTEPVWIQTTLRSLRIALWTTLISGALGIFAAYGLVRSTFKGKRLLTMFLLSPIMTPTVVVGLGLYVYFLHIGVANGELRIVLGHVVLTLPFVIVTAMAGLRHIEPSLEAAATIMGASPMTVLRRVTLPLLTPAIVGGMLFAFLISFDEVIVAWFVSTPRSVTLPIQMYSSIQWGWPPVLAAISTLLTLFSVIVCLTVALAGGSLFRAGTGSG